MSWTDGPVPVPMSWTGGPVPVPMSWAGEPVPVPMSWTGGPVPVPMNWTGMNWLTSSLRKRTGRNFIRKFVLWCFRTSSFLHELVHQFSSWELELVRQFSSSELELSQSYRGLRKETFKPDGWGGPQVSSWWKKFFSIESMGFYTVFCADSRWYLYSLVRMRDIIENRSKSLTFTEKSSKIHIFRALWGLFGHEGKTFFETFFYHFVEDKKLHNICENQPGGPTK